MLVIERKEGQSVFIGEDIKVTLKKIRSNKVRMSFEAPVTVQIARSEIKKPAADEVHNDNMTKFLQNIVWELVNSPKGFVPDIALPFYNPKLKEN